MSLNAYQTLQKKVETPRETEYRLFTQVTRALIEAASLPKTEIARRMDALDWNRRVWTFLASDCYDPNNALPEQLRAGIISLSIFVGKYTSEIMQKDADIETLIDINRTIMQGLAGQIEANTAA
ncbi:MAG: flagellar biosynthesis regulator FlaF [Caulobacterales bacterium]|nr:flagellar biosynthesis regulator FlaF [Caulobacterales bacterium]MCA0371632.1 flagellar biosynthesis regulator FlaF [Pseudomonadota bacterium]